MFKNMSYGPRVVFSHADESTPPKICALTMNHYVRLNFHSVGFFDGLHIKRPRSHLEEAFFRAGFGYSDRRWRRMGSSSIRSSQETDDGRTDGQLSAGQSRAGGRGANGSLLACFHYRKNPAHLGRGRNAFCARSSPFMPPTFHCDSLVVTYLGTSVRSAYD